MINTNFKSLIDFLTYFKDEETCKKYFEDIRFKDGKFCPHCGHKKIHRFKDGKRFRCADCRKDFTLRTGTIFGESKIPLQKWFIAIYLLTTSKKGISSVQLAKQVGTTQKTAWFIDHRIRKAMAQGRDKLSGDIEVDETYIGGKEKNKHFNKRTRGTQGRNTLTKTPVVGFRERTGKVKAHRIYNVRRITIERAINENISRGSNIFTDDFKSYRRINRTFRHQIVKHGVGEYVRGNVHTNGIESFWAVFKRGYIGTYHHLSDKHLQRYINEFVYRFNHQKAEIGEVFANTIHNVARYDKMGYNALTKGI